MYSFKKIWAEIVCLWKKVKELEQNEGSNDGIQSIKEGDNISIDSSDPKNPIISALGGQTEILNWNPQIYSEGDLVSHDNGIWRSEVENKNDEPTSENITWTLLAEINETNTPNLAEVISEGNLIDSSITSIIDFENTNGSNTILTLQNNEVFFGQDLLNGLFIKEDGSVSLDSSVGLNLNGQLFPPLPGTVGQILTTDENGILSWENLESDLPTSETGKFLVGGANDWEKRTILGSDLGISVAGRVPFTTAGGWTTGLEVSQQPSGTTIAERTSSPNFGRLKATDAIENNDLVPLGQLNSLFSNNLNGLLENPTYDSDTHVFTMDVRGGGTFSIDFPIEALITNVDLDVDDNLIITFEDGSITTVPLNTLLVGVVKSVNGKTPNSQGQVVINAEDIDGIHNPLSLGVNVNGLTLNTSTQTLQLGLSSTNSTGALSSTDWNIFNNKVDFEDISNFVPYTGATQNVDLNTRSITSTGGFIGNATTATTLATPKSINGTSFDGSANIVTSRWGFARSITIGNTMKTVDGSANVSWSLAEIGVTNQNLSLGASAGQIDISNGTGVTLHDLNRTTLVDFNDVSGIKTGSFTTFYNNTGSLGYPSSAGQGIMSLRSATTQGSFALWSSNSDSQLDLYLNVGSSSGWTGWKSIATTDNIPTNYITTNTHQTELSGNKTTSGAWTYESTTATPLRIQNNNTSNISISYGLNGSFWYAGLASQNVYAIGNSWSLSTIANRLFWIGNTGLVSSKNGFNKYGQNDTQILLAGGGHRPVSDFALANDIDEKANTDGSNTTGGTWIIDALRNDDVSTYATIESFTNELIGIPPTDALVPTIGVTLMKDGAPLVIAESDGVVWDGYIYRAGTPKAGYPANQQNGNYLIESKHRFRVHKHDNLDDLSGGVGSVILNPYSAIEHQYFDVNISEAITVLELYIQSPERDELTGHIINRNTYGQRISVNVRTGANVTFTGVQGVSFPNGWRPGVYKYVWDGMWTFDGYSPNEF